MEDDFSSNYQAFVDQERERQLLGRKQRAKTFWSCCSWCWCCFSRPAQHRLIKLNAGRPTKRRQYSRNAVKNTKYTPLTFVPKLLYEQFRYFFNLYYLIVALSQFFPPLRIGLLFTYIAPLVFVLAVTMVKEAYDDVQRWRTDLAINHERYERLLPSGAVEGVKAQDICVGHVIRVSTDQRVPADLVMLRTHDMSGTAFVRTDQLDGETDWKLRLAVPSCQKLTSDAALAAAVLTLRAGPPTRDIYDFTGDVTLYDEAYEGGCIQEPLALENTLWANTVLASGIACGIVVHTGTDTRSSMNSSAKPPSKMATLDLQVNSIAKLLFLLVTVFALAMVVVPIVQSWAFNNSLPAFSTALSQRLLQALLDFVCFILLFSQIIPISLRVALDVAKLVYKMQMSSDKRLPGLQVRSSTLPEELGGIEYLLTDKTGTLTRNEMKFKKLHLGFACLSDASLTELQHTLASVLAAHPNASLAPATSEAYTTAVGAAAAIQDGRRVSRDGDMGEDEQRPGASAAAAAGDGAQGTAIAHALLAIALCHNVSPVDGAAGPEPSSPQPPTTPAAAAAGAAAAGSSGGDNGGSSGGSGEKRFQGASPDELALVQFAARCGIVLTRRTPSTMTLRDQTGFLRVYEVLHEMPFSSELKRMGVLLRHVPSGEVLFYVKGADSVMMDRVSGADWVEEEVGNLAREGLRTLVVAYRSLTEGQYAAFAAELHKARLAKSGRNAAVRSAFEMLEEGMAVLCITAVEDRLQANVRTTLEMLRGANVRTWMLTGDKLETATIVAQNSSLVARHQAFYTVNVRSRAEARQQLNGYPQGTINAPCLILDGASLDLCVEHVKLLFIEVACAAPTVVVCRCSPTQKASIVTLLREHTNKCTAAIGDGGNDVGMIHAAHVGIGVEGREGRQAALAADFSVTQFSHVARLVLWHGRNCYLRSATLSQFVIHRGLIISTIQLVFSSLFYFRPIQLYNGLLVLGYATIFTSGPVISLVLDEDVSEMNALKFPELYRELQKRRYLSIKTFLLWAWKALYQGGVIMLGGVLLFEQRFVHVVGITFTALILTENLMVAVEVKKGHPFMLLAQVLTLLVYVAALVALSSPMLLDATFDLQFILTVDYAWRTALLTAASTVPIWFGKWFSNYLAPSFSERIAG